VSLWERKRRRKKKLKKEKSSDGLSAMKGISAISKYLLALIDLVAKEYNVPYSEWPSSGTDIFLIFWQDLILCLVITFIEDKTKEKYGKLVAGADSLDVDWIREKIRNHCWDRRKKFDKKKSKPKGTPEYESEELLSAQFNLNGENLQKFLLAQGVSFKSEVGSSPYSTSGPPPGLKICN
jgi:hypothetical protein